MERDERKNGGSEQTASAQEAQRATRPAPGKVTRTSRLSPRNAPAVQRRADPGSVGAAPRQAWDQTMDPWMDAAHRGVTALAERGMGARGDDATATAGAGGQAVAPGAAPQPAMTTAEGGQSGTIARIGPAEGESIVRGAGEGQEDLQATRSDNGTPDAGPGGTTGATPTPTPNLTVTTAITSSYDQLNSLTVPPFGEMIPSFEFLDVTWTVSGNTCNVSARLMCHYPWGVNGGTAIDVPSGADPVVTNAMHPSSGKKVWETIVDDLTPSGTSPHKSPRDHYWSSALTGRHERYHGIDDYAWVTSTGKPDAEAFIQSRTISRASTGADVTSALDQARRRVAQGSDAYYGVGLDHNLRPGEIRAYADGRPHYQALADAVTVRGRALDAGTGGGGGGGGSGGGSGSGGGGVGGGVRPAP